MKRTHGATVSYRADVTAVAVDRAAEGGFRFVVDVVLPDGVPLRLTTSGVCYVPIVPGGWPLMSLFLECVPAAGMVGYERGPARLAVTRGEAA